MINRKDLTVEIDGFLNTLSDTGKDEWYDTDRAVHGQVLAAFVKHLYKAEDDRAERYRQYIQLYAEFGDNQ
jgi:hypothetical protein